MKKWIKKAAKNKRRDWYVEAAAELYLMQNVMRKIEGKAREILSKEGYNQTCEKMEEAFNKLRNGFEEAMLLYDENGSLNMFFGERNEEVLEEAEKEATNYATNYAEFFKILRQQRREEGE